MLFLSVSGSPDAVAQPLGEEGADATGRSRHGMVPHPRGAGVSALGGVGGCRVLLNAPTCSSYCGRN